MEIVVSIFSAVVAMSCLFAVVKSDIQDSKKHVRNDAGIADSRP
jgi:hypothetical protein